MNFRIRGKKFTALRGAALVYVGAVGALMAGGMAARAAGVTITATFNASQPNTVATTLMSNYNDNNAGLSTTTVSTVAGIYNFTATNITGGAGSAPLSLSTVESSLGITSPGGLPGVASGVFQAVCIDFTHNISYGQSSTWTVQNLTTVTAGINGVGINANQANAIGYLWNTYFPVPKTDSASAAFQMAVWDIVYDGGGTSLSSLTTTGSPSADTNKPIVSYSDGSDAAIAQVWALAAMDQVTNHNYTATNVYALVDTEGVQSFAIVGTQAVPLPASASVGFCMLVGLGAFSAFRKHRRSGLVTI